MSASPLLTISSACSGLTISPTVRVGIFVSRFTRAAIGTLYPGSVGLRMSAATPPDEMQMKSIPSPFSAREIATGVAGGQPALAPVTAGNARAQHNGFRHHRPYRARDRQRKAQAVL